MKQAMLLKRRRYWFYPRMHKKSREQQLVDICFSLVMTATDKHNMKYFGDGNSKNEKVGEWVADQLRRCGFPTHQQGCSWGVLDD